MSGFTGYYPDSSNNHIGTAKRRRAVLACTACRRRKIRCDVGQPACGHCVKTGLECVYDSSKRRKAQRGYSDSESHSPEVRIDRRLERVETLLATLMEKQGIATNGIGKHSDTTDKSSDSSQSSDSEDDQEGTESESGSSESKLDHKADLYDLVQRRGLSHTSVVKRTDTEPWSVYSHGVTNAVLTPTCMRWLCARIGRPELGKNAEGILRWLWMRSERSFWEWPTKAQHAPELDVGMVRYSLDQFRKCKGMPILGLLNKNDVDAAISSSGSDLESNIINMNSPYALVFPTVVMWLTKYARVTKFGPYTSDQGIEQHRLAFVHGTRIALNLFLTRPTLLLLRLLVAFVHLMSHRALLSQLRSLVAVSLSMAMTLGLQREETFRNLDPESRRQRKLLWLTAQHFEIAISLYLFQQPLITTPDFVPLSNSEWESVGPLWAMRQRFTLNRLYMEAYQKIFSVNARTTSVYRLLKYILKYDGKLSRWKENLPSSVRDPIAVAKDLTRILTSANDRKGNELEPCELLDKVSRPCTMIVTFIIYYHILILLHSIPALTPSSLEAFRNKPDGVPDRLKKSLDIITDSARMVLAILTHGQGAVTEALTVYLASNAFCVLVLKQIRTPRHPTNASDVLLVYRFISVFKKLIAHPNSAITGLIAQRVMSSWLVAATVMKEITRQHQPLLEESIKLEIREAEAEARSGVDTSFLDESADSSRKQTSEAEPAGPSKTADSPGTAESNGSKQTPPVSVHDQQPRNFSSSVSPRVQLTAPQDLRTSARTSPCPGPVQPAYSPSMLGSADWQMGGAHGRIAPLVKPRSGQSSIPQAPPPAPQLSPLHQFNGTNVRSSSPYPVNHNLVPEVLESNSPDGARLWPANLPLNSQQPVYASPAEENSLWDAFSGVSITQDSIFDQTSALNVPNEMIGSEITEDCIIA